MSKERAEQARRVAGSLAAALRQQQELGVSGVPLDVARRLHDWLQEAPALLTSEGPAAATSAALPRTASPARARFPAAPVERAQEPAAPSLKGAGADAAPSGRTEESELAVPEAQAHADAAPGREPESRRAPQRKPSGRAGARPPYARQGDAGRSLGLGSPALEQIRAELGDCERCGLCTRRSNIVFGVGSPSARLMFIGEAPDEREDRLGEPFVGPAGELLTKMIGAMGLARSEVYIANVIKCRPPANRDPMRDEVASCLPFLKKQVSAVAPDVIVTLGGVAPQALLERDIHITKERGTWTEFEGVPTMLTLHPAYLLRQPAAKRDAWSDLQQVMQRLGLTRR